MVVGVAFGLYSSSQNYTPAEDQLLVTALAYFRYFTNVVHELTFQEVFEVESGRHSVLDTL